MPVFPKWSLFVRFSDYISLALITPIIVSCPVHLIHEDDDNLSYKHLRVCLVHVCRWTHTQLAFVLFAHNVSALVISFLNLFFCLCI
jgi:hypothetical protein